MTVDVRVNVEKLGAQLDLGDILEVEDFTVRICPQNDVPVLLRLVISPDIGQDVFA